MKASQKQEQTKHHPPQSTLTVREFMVQLRALRGDSDLQFFERAAGRLQGVETQVAQLWIIAIFAAEGLQGMKIRTSHQE